MYFGSEKEEMEEEKLKGKLNELRLPPLASPLFSLPFGEK